MGGIMSDDRAFTNSMSDYDTNRPDHSLYTSDGNLTDQFKRQINDCIGQLTQQIDSALRHKTAEGTSASHDAAIYTGVCDTANRTLGIALLYEKLSRAQNNGDYLQKSVHLVEKCLSQMRGRRVGYDEVTFLCGDTGPLALGAVVYKRTEQNQNSEQCVERLSSLSGHVALSVRDMPDEMLYGRAGYLYACLYVNKRLHANAIPQTVIAQVANDILSSGAAFAKRTPQLHSPLMYEWHDSLYLGAAHGIAGILFMLMQLPDIMSDSHKAAQIRGCLDFMLTLQYPSGNYPSSIGSRGDRLIHWCHGAPGWVHTMILAHKVFHDQKYIDSAVRCGEVIWQRGLLRKGYGLCHGTAGNAYGLLALWQHTHELKWLHRTCKFVQFIFDYGSHGCRIADRPFSLMEGMAGTVYFLVDMLNPSEAAFPTFYVA